MGLWQRVCVVHRSTGCLGRVVPEPGHAASWVTGSAGLTGGVMPSQAARAVKDCQAGIRRPTRADRRAHVVPAVPLLRDLKRTPVQGHPVVPPDPAVLLHAQRVGQRRAGMDHGKDSFAILTHPTPSGHNWQIMAD